MRRDRGEPYKALRDAFQHPVVQHRECRDSPLGWSPDPGVVKAMF